MDEEALFAAALGRSDAAERRAFLDAACGGDRRLRDRVDRLLARLEAEQQALALMDHPNIAKVYDAGTTETRRPDGSTLAGRPYFVMELVAGVPITRFCDEHRLTVRQRLGLFVPVCRAVQ